MQSIENTETDKLRLLSTYNLDEVLAIIGQIVVKAAPKCSGAISVWDPDVESFSDSLAFGERKEEFGRLAVTFAPDELPGAKQFLPVDDDSFNSERAENFVPIFSLGINAKEEFCACLLLSGADAGVLSAIAEGLLHYPLGLVIRHAWEFRELTKENERLRARYEELEDRIVSMEEQTRKLIHDVMAKDALRTKQTDRERLVYGISNFVRSSLNIEEVLQRAVDNIGATYQVSRALVLRILAGPERVDAYEYKASSVSPIREHFLTAEGLDFMRLASSKSVPQFLANPELDSGDNFDREFLKKLDYHSGLLVPLIMRDQVIGLLLLQEVMRQRDWDIDDVSVLGALADQLSVGIENARLHEEKKLQAVMDELTGIANRRRFMEIYQMEFERAKRYGEPLSLVIVDLDFLKKINDTYGHHAGDIAIAAIGRLLKQASRAVDLPARYGGEEFCLLLPNTDLAMAEQIAERVRKLIADTTVEGPGQITASIGVACYPRHGENPAALFEAADQALYEAKKGGRNRVCLAGTS